ncbi:hypothetical protein ACFOW6_06930 [Fodinicurvata halophila]|uniref:Lipoprotein n=1 Tax=Fodinicurvata halophila TaxID=1419723 RepID=A0ABV8UKE1_9PROT
MKHLKLLLPLLLLLTLSGCGGAAVMLASAALSGLGGAVGGGMSSGMESTGGYRSPHTASGVQNGGQVDESIGQALQVSDQDVTNACRARLPEESNLPLAAGECEIRMTCLPGAQAPMRLRMCMPPDAGPDNVSAESDAASRPTDQAL